jgi:uncharacterized protein (DUF362 family)/NAD-dependent dihydropyrimidine dehydrogenase PreA subunit
LSEAVLDSPVAIRRCDDYADCASAVDACMAASGLAEAVRGMRRVLLKPNLMRGTPPEACNGTHPVLLAMLVRWFRDRGIQVVVGDSSGLVGFTDQVLDVSGVRDACEQAGAQVVNLDAGPFRALAPIGTPPLRFLVPELLFEVDGYLHVPKFKTHTFLGLTLAMKNVIGVLPGATKPALHERRPDRDAFANAVLDLHGALDREGARCLGALVDGIWALGGRGPGIGPRPVGLGLVAAGADLAAVDMACALAAGFAPGSLPLTRAALARGLGPASPRNLVVDGPDPRSWNPRLPTPSRDFMERTRVTTRIYYWFRGRLVRPVVDSGRCRQHEQCVEVCPVDAIRMVDGVPRIGPQCIRCMACISRCPEGAIRLGSRPLLRTMLAHRLDGIPFERPPSPAAIDRFPDDETGS